MNKIILGVVAFLSFSLAGSVFYDDAVPAAGSVIGTTGIQGGVVVYLGCGDGSSEMASSLLDAQGPFLIQYLDGSEDNVAAIRKK